MQSQNKVAVASPLIQAGYYSFMSEIAILVFYYLCNVVTIFYEIILDFFTSCPK